MLHLRPLVMRIKYGLDPRGLAMLRQDLDDAGIAYARDPSLEHRSEGGDVVPTGAIFIAGALVAGFLNKAGGDAYDATKGVVEKWHARPLLGQRVDLDK